MAVNDYITLNNKKYKVVADGYQPVLDRQKVYSTGLTGKTIVQDFTVSTRVPQSWGFRLRVFIDAIEGTGWGNWSDLKTAYASTYVSFTEHDASIPPHQVGMAGQLMPVPRVPANISGVCYGIYFVDVLLLKRQI